MPELSEEELKKVTDDEHTKRWYVVNTYSGHEDSVKKNLERRVKTMGIEDSLFRIVVAEEPEIEIKNGKQVEKMHNLFPGYVFVEMKMTDEAWYVVRNTPGVTGFIGSSGGGAKPFPVADAEMESILRRVSDSETRVSVDFKVGDTVEILSGSFQGKRGTISTMNDQTQSANVAISLFAGREVPTELKYKDIRKVDD